MKAIILWIMICVHTSSLFAQKTQVFSLSPLARETKKVNGLVVGVGHFGKKGETKEINGLNVELMALSPFVVFMAAMYGSNLKQTHSDTAVNVNGINLALGGYLTSVNHKGINIAMYNAGHSMRGISFNATFNAVHEMKGLSIAGFGNYTDYATGLNIAPINFDKRMRGVQIGIYNKSLHVKGLQIGLINISDDVCGMQLGLLNKNRKRVLPFINF